MSSFRLACRALAVRLTVGYLLALVAVVALSAALDFVSSRVHVAHTSMAYLIVVLITALTMGRGPAILAALASALSLSWFFAEPLYSLHVADPGEWLLLLTFLATAVITSELTAAERRRAQEASQREREAIVLAEVTRLLVESDLGTAMQRLAERLREELDLAAATIEVVEGDLICKTVEVGDEIALAAARSGSGGRVGEGETALPRGLSAEPRDRAAGATRYWHEEAPVSVQNRASGRVSVVRAAAAAPFTGADRRLLAAVATQLGLICERERLRRQATEGEILRRSDEMKTALLRSVSHDLRTPLAAILAAADSLLAEDVEWTPAESREFARTIRRGAQRLNHIVEHLLDMSRIEAGILHPRKDWYDVRALLDDVIGKLEDGAGSRRIEVDVPEDLPPIHLDYAQMTQVLVNLIENAAKYCPPDAEIRVSVRYQCDEVRIEVADRGPGIPEDALPHVFEPFYRGEARASRPQGVGLGLAVAKGLVAAHEGSICAENRPEGGARFVIRLPSARPEEAPIGKVEASL